MRSTIKGYSLSTCHFISSRREMHMPWPMESQLYIVQLGIRTLTLLGLASRLYYWYMRFSSQTMYIQQQISEHRYIVQQKRKALRCSNRTAAVCVAKPGKCVRNRQLTLSETKEEPFDCLFQVLFLLVAKGKLLLLSLSAIKESFSPCGVQAQHPT